MEKKCPLAEDPTEIWFSNIFLGPLVRIQWYPWNGLLGKSYPFVKSFLFKYIGLVVFVKYGGGQGEAEVNVGWGWKQGGGGGWWWGRWGGWWVGGWGEAPRLDPARAFTGLATPVRQPGLIYSLQETFCSSTLRPLFTISNSNLK